MSPRRSLVSDIDRPGHGRSPPVLVGGPITSDEGPPTPAGGLLVSVKEPQVSVKGTTYQLEGILYRSSAYCVGQTVS